MIRGFVTRCRRHRGKRVRAVFLAVQGMLDVRPRLLGIDVTRHMVRLVSRRTAKAMGRRAPAQRACRGMVHVGHEKLVKVFGGLELRPRIPCANKGPLHHLRHECDGVLTEIGARLAAERGILRKERGLEGFLVSERGVRQRGERLRRDGIARWNRHRHDGLQS